MRHPTLTLLSVLVLAAGCGPSPTASPVATPATAGQSAAAVDPAALCQGADFLGCEDKIRGMLGEMPGALVAICAYPDHSGDVVAISSEDAAEDGCSRSGSIEGSRVVRVARLP